MVELNRQGWANRDIAQELQISGRSGNAYLNQIRMRGSYPGGAPGPSPKALDPWLNWAAEMAPDFVWTPAPANLAAMRHEPADGAQFEFDCPIDFKSFAKEVGEGLYELRLLVGDLILFRSQVRISRAYGPPRFPAAG